jgi:ElaB/YqjD/DUF883 family membrane-anchored ribosome-binding protein
MANDKKFTARSLSTISRDNGSFSRSEIIPDWLNDFAKSQQAITTTKADSNSIYDQINSILGNKGKFSTVQEAVENFKQRTGLTEYLKQIKQAQDTKEDVFSKIPELKTFIDNYVDAHPGTSIEAVIHDLLKLKSVKENLPEANDLPEDIKRYINDKITEKRQNSPYAMKEDLQLGKVDVKVDDNLAKDNDPFGGCNPNRQGM